MAKTCILPACLVFLLALCLATSANARRWKWWYYGGHDLSERGERDDDGGYRRTHAAELPDPALRGSRGAFGTIVERLISGCGQQADQLANLPYDNITRIAAPDGAQRAALEALRGTAALAAERFAADCPQSVPAAPEVRAAEQAIDAATSAFATVEPALQKFYSALDEQKARLLRDMTFADSQPRSADRRADRSRDRWRNPPDRWDRRSSRWRAYARAYDPKSGRPDGVGSNRAAESPFCGEGSGAPVARSSSRRCPPTRNAPSPNRWASACEDLTSALRTWPIREIERGVGLSEPQRVAFYELVTTSLRAADTLAGACPADTELTPVGRMAGLRARAHALL
jgi:hypothetical protein